MPHCIVLSCRCIFILQQIEKIHIAVPKNAVGAIIGREGSVVNGIRHASGASVQVLKSDEDAVETMVELRGYPHQLSMVCNVLLP